MGSAVSGKGCGSQEPGVAYRKRVSATHLLAHVSWLPCLSHSANSQQATCSCRTERRTPTPRCRGFWLGCSAQVSAATLVSRIWLTAAVRLTCAAWITLRLLSRVYLANCASSPAGLRDLAAGARQTGDGGLQVAGTQVVFAAGAEVVERAAEDADRGR